jgi:hypothetical protein
MVTTKQIEACADEIAADIMDSIAHCFRDEEHHDLYFAIHDAVIEGLSALKSEAHNQTNAALQNAREAAPRRQRRAIHQKWLSRDRSIFLACQGNG